MLLRFFFGLQGKVAMEARTYTFETKLSCVSSTPFGFPVVPEV